jgi:hypothetical protein
MRRFACDSVCRAIRETAYLSFGLLLVLHLLLLCLHSLHGLSFLGTLFIGRVAGLGAECVSRSMPLLACDGSVRAGTDSKGDRPFLRIPSGAAPASPKGVTTVGDTASIDMMLFLDVLRSVRGDNSKI